MKEKRARIDGIKMGKEREGERGQGGERGREEGGKREREQARKT